MIPIFATFFSFSSSPSFLLEKRKKGKNSQSNCKNSCFSDWSFFLYCSLYSYRSSNYCNSNSLTIARFFWQDTFSYRYLNRSLSLSSLLLFLIVLSIEHFQVQQFLKNPGNDIKPFFVNLPKSSFNFLINLLRHYTLLKIVSSVFSFNMCSIFKNKTF